MKLKKRLSCTSLDRAFEAEAAVFSPWNMWQCARRNSTFFWEFTAQNGLLTSHAKRIRRTISSRSMSFYGELSERIFFFCCGFCVRVKWNVLVHELVQRQSAHVKDVCRKRTTRNTFFRNRFLVLSFLCFLLFQFSSFFSQASILAWSCFFLSCGESSYFNL